MQSPKHSWDRGGIACQTATVLEEWVQWEATVSKKKIGAGGEQTKNENEHEPMTTQMMPTWIKRKVDDRVARKSKKPNPEKIFTTSPAKLLHCEPH